jgi:ferredoxin
VAGSAKVPVLYGETAECCGCAACVAVCAQGAISMVSDEEGFAYPTIDPTLCIRCLLCVRVCPMKELRVSRSLDVSTEVETL